MLCRFLRTRTICVSAMEAFNTLSLGYTYNHPRLMPRIQTSCSYRDFESENQNKSVHISSPLWLHNPHPLPLLQPKQTPRPLHSTTLLDPPSIALHTSHRLSRLLLFRFLDGLVPIQTRYAWASAPGGGTPTSKLRYLFLLILQAGRVRAVPTAEAELPECRWIWR